MHQSAWLLHSARNSPEGKVLQSGCEERGLRQLVREPTRKEHLLDLVLSDFESVKCTVEPEVADHKVVVATLGNMLTVLLCSQVRGVRSSWMLAEISCLSLSL